jgi:hypothetical protein
MGTREMSTQQKHTRNTGTHGSSPRAFVYTLVVRHQKVGHGPIAYILLSRRKEEVLRTQAPEEVCSPFEVLCYFLLMTCREIFYRHKFLQSVAIHHPNSLISQFNRFIYHQIKHL